MGNPGATSTRSSAQSVSPDRAALSQAICRRRAPQYRRFPARIAEQFSTPAPKREQGGIDASGNLHDADAICGGPAAFSRGLNCFQGGL
jgi:hypothetical protein